MQIKKIDSKNIWESFLLGVENKTFLQSWNWGEFQKAMGEKVWRLGLYEDLRLIGIAQVIKVKARRGTFLLIPHGPLANVKCQILTALITKLKRIAKEEGCIFIRIAPVWKRDEENKKLFKELGFKPAPIHTHPELTWMLDLRPSEDELLMNMRKTTRYLIKQGLKNRDLEIVKSQNVKDVEFFNKLYQETVVRHHFVPFSLKYLKNEFLSFVKDNQSLIFLAKYKGECLASAVIIFWQGIAFYHQGASSQKYSKIPASYLLQWEAIKEAKNRGCHTYNFWGIADVKTEKELKKHPWKGVGLFKKGFGGWERAYFKTQDLPLSKRYRLTYIIETLRKKKRGF